MLDGIAVSQPQPKIPPELIKFLGKVYNAWQASVTPPGPQRFEG
jgi:transformation/transcription domain-associated protein